MFQAESNTWRGGCLISSQYLYGRLGDGGVANSVELILIAKTAQDFSPQRTPRAQSFRFCLLKFSFPRK